MIESPIGPITMRPPTEEEAIRFEDKYRPRKEGGSVYDNGIEEVLGCVVSHKPSALHPSDDGLLSDCPGFFVRLVAEFQRQGGGNLGVIPSEWAKDHPSAKSLGKKAVGVEYDGNKVLARKLTWAEYCAYTNERNDSNVWALIARYGGACMVEALGSTHESVRSRYPYFTMALGAHLLEIAMGGAESRAKKLERDSQTKITISTSPQQVSSPQGMEGSGAK